MPPVSAAPDPASPGRLLPDLSPREELALLARALWREGYDDHLAGHITYRQPDGTLLCNPWLVLWEELRPEDVLRIDLDGTVLEGDRPAPPGIALHLALHRARGDVTVAVHHHPRYATVWADAGRVPPCYDQSSALGGGELVVVDEYDGPVNDPSSAERAVAAMGGAPLALLSNHGVVVLAGSIRAAHQRAVALEQRCRHAWHVEAIGGGRELPDPARSFFAASNGEGFVGFWEAMARRELRLDPTLLDGPARPPHAPTPPPPAEGAGGAAEGAADDAGDGFVTHADRLLRSARHYAEQHPAREHLDVRPRLRLAVVACMDSRIDLFDLLELEVGDAHVLRNAGGIVTDDVVRSLALSQRILGTREIVLVHHTDCGMEKVKEDEFKAALEAETGIRPAWALENFTDPFADVRQSLARVQANPFLLDRRHVRGFVYDVDTRELIPVEPAGS
jgi:ribulose-5-phosphate 4-epimerase/fuculose-1-phosphate aldolase/carbonic anhydrase